MHGVHKLINGHVLNCVNSFIMFMPGDTNTSVNEAAIDSHIYGVSKGHLSRDLPISGNDLPISVNELPISGNELPISVNRLDLPI